MRTIRVFLSLLSALVCLAHGHGVAGAEEARPVLRLAWNENILTARAPWLPGGALEIWYLEAFCRPGSTDRDWHETVIGHSTKLVEAPKDGQSLALQSTLEDGVTVDHRIRVVEGGIAFECVARNPTDKDSEAHWAQPCVRVGGFTGTQGNEDRYAYVPKCFIFIDGKQAFLPSTPWATEARYTPGQVWCPKSVPRTDVNPRPLSDLVPSNGLIGCVSGDGKWLLASAWEPYQELFQGVIRCIHSDFRIGGLAPGGTRKIRGMLYVLPNDVKALLARYGKDFPEHARSPERPAEP